MNAQKKMHKPGLRIKAEDLLLDGLIMAFMIGVVIVTVYPFLNVIAYSFNDGMDSLKGGITIIPRVFTTMNYAQIFRNDEIFSSLLISVLRTVIGGVATSGCSMVLGYVLSRKEFIARRVLTILLIFTMYFSGGLIPGYLLMRSLKLIGTFWIYILPGLVSTWNALVVKSYIVTSIPDAIVESSRIDGASEFRTLLQIVLPLSLPVLATILLWSSVGQWNSWFDVYLYNNNKPALSTLQFELQKMLQRTMITSSGSSTAIANEASQAGQSGQGFAMVPQAMRSAMTVVATVPILMVYPFLQRYFINGLTICGVKG